MNPESQMNNGTTVKVNGEDHHHDNINLGVDADIEITKHKKGPHLKEAI